MISRKLNLLFFIFPLFVHTQSFSGVVIDAKTNEPLEMVSVYFDNTTLGTSTDEKGKFSLEYSDAIQSALVISFLGYEKIYLTNYRDTNNVTISLIEQESELDEVVVDFDDGLTRRQKLKLFKDNFLGTSKLGRSCKILNLEDIFLRYDKADRTLTASASREIIVENNLLGYRIKYDLIDFEIIFRYVSPKRNRFDVNLVSYYGTVFFEEIHSDKSEKLKRFSKKRNAVYKGSVQHFMRSVYNQSFKEDGYHFVERGFKISPYKYLLLSDKKEDNFVTASLTRSIGIQYDNRTSLVQPQIEEFKVDKYGNYYPVTGILFGGDMGDQRVGDMLPIDYNLNTNNLGADANFIVGNWSVVDIVKYPEAEPFNTMIDSFKNAEFIFNPDKTLELKSTVSNSFFSMMSSVLNESVWQFYNNTTTSSIKVKSEDGKTQIEIFIIKKGEAVFFALGKGTEPSYFLLKVEKQ